MRTIKLTRGLVAKVDDADFEWLNQFKWQVIKSERGKYYAYRRKTVNGHATAYYLHREILGLSRGDGKLCDHRDGDTLNNQRKNLRLATPQQNSSNRCVGSNNTSGHTGVYRDRNRWRARVRAGGRVVYSGSFITKAEAVAARRAAARAIFGDFCGRT